MYAKFPKIAVGILGATGVVGQKLVAMLIRHPWFEVAELTASAKAQGCRYETYANWREPIPLPAAIGQLPLQSCQADLQSRILFSGLDSSVAGEVEEFYARRGHVVISNAKNHRQDVDVPLMIPEINAEHLQLIPLQQRRWKSRGYIITNPNCSVVALALTLVPIWQRWGLKQVAVTTMQAISGAGYPGVAALDLLGNLVPYIQDEEEKIQLEPLKIFGSYHQQQIKPASIKISASCNRVPVQHGHTMSIAFTPENDLTAAELIEAWQTFPGADLPSAPCAPLQYCSDPARPQPVLDSGRSNGMAVTLGNLRPCPVLGWKVTALGHNLIRGAAGAAILNAELVVTQGLHR